MNSPNSEELFYSNELELSPEGYPIVPSELLEFPSENPSNTLRPVKCSECDFVGEAGVAFSQPPKGQCPDCGKELALDFSRHSWGIGARGPGFHSTKFGMRRKASMLKQSEKLARTQWENHAPMAVVNPDRVKNPTPGGVLDPNSKFNKHKRKSGSSSIIY